MVCTGFREDCLPGGHRCYRVFTVREVKYCRNVLARVKRGGLYVVFR